MVNDIVNSQASVATKWTALVSIVSIIGLNDFLITMKAYTHDCASKKGLKSAKSSLSGFSVISRRVVLSKKQISVLG